MVFQLSFWKAFFIGSCRQLHGLSVEKKIEIKTLKTERVILYKEGLKNRNG
jgi:hypothetical protein